MEVSSLRTLYRKLIPYEARFWFYKIRHKEEIRVLRKKVYPSKKGDFSLRAFDAHKCMFVHITKTAGTSVSKSLFGELPYHYTAVQYRVIFGRDLFNQYYKFAFVRNPWDRLYSAYSYLRDGGWNDRDKAWYSNNIGDISDFNAFVMNWLNEKRLRSHVHLKPQSDFICDNRNRPMIDYLGYFETLPKDFAHIAKVLRMRANLAHVNASKRNDYRQIYSREAIDKVRDLYHHDIDNFGYDFDGVKARKVVCNRKFADSSVQ